MKKIVSSIVILLTFNSTIMAEQGFDLEKEIVINVSANELWEMIGPGFVDVYKWSSNVDHAEGKGKSEFAGAVCDERFCDVNVKGFSSISEKLTYYSQDKKALSYEVMNGMPGFVTKAMNNWVVVPISENQSKLVMRAQFRSKGIMGFFMNGMMRKKMDETLQTVLNDAKVYAETGSVSTAKQERINELEEKMKKAA